MAVTAEAGAFAAEPSFIAERDMDDATFPAVHGVEAERLAGVLHFFGGGVGAETNFGYAERTVIVGIEGQARVILRGNLERLHGYVFQSEE